MTVGLFRIGSTAPGLPLTDRWRYHRIDEQRFVRLPWVPEDVAVLESLDCAVVAATADLASTTPALAYLLGRGAAVLAVEATVDTLVVRWVAGEAVATSVNSFLEQQERKAQRQTAVQRARERIEHSGFSPGGTGMARAAALGDLATIEAFLVLGISADSCDEAGIPVLHHAVRGAAWPVVELLLDQKPQIDAVAPDRGTTALLELASARQPALVQRCLEAGATVDYANTNGQTALILAVGAQDEQTALLLLENSADPDVTDSLGMSARKYGQLFGLSNVLERIS